MSYADTEAHLHDLRHRCKAVVTTTIQRSFDGLSKVIQCM